MRPSTASGTQWSGRIACPNPTPAAAASSAGPVALTPCRACAAGLHGETETQVLGVRDGLAQQRTDVIIVQRVDHLPAIALADHEPEVAKHPELLRDRGLSHAEVAGEVADRTGAGPEAAEDPHPARRRERLHRLGDRARGIGRQEREVRLCAMSHARIIACIAVNKSGSAGLTSSRVEVQRSWLGHESRQPKAPPSRRRADRWQRERRGARDRRPCRRRRVLRARVRRSCVVSGRGGVPRACTRASPRPTRVPHALDLGERIRALGNRANRTRLPGNAILNDVVIVLFVVDLAILVSPWT